MKKRRILSRRARVLRMTGSGIALGLLNIVMLAMSLFDLYPSLRTLFPDPSTTRTIGIGAAFVSIYLLLACILSLATSRKAPSLPQPKTLTAPMSAADGMTLQGILLGEFAYARETAAQAMEERRSVTNFYLLIVGGALSGVVALLSTLTTRSSLVLGAVAALWLVCVIGLLTLFGVISLRLAWVGSASAMNHVKEFYLANAEKLGATHDILQSAFSYRTDTVPPADAHWNVNHFASLLIGCLDAAAFLMGLVLMGVMLSNGSILPICLTGSALAVFVFMAHWWSYDLSLTPK